MWFSSLQASMVVAVTMAFPFGGATCCCDWGVLVAVQLFSFSTMMRARLAAEMVTVEEYFSSLTETSGEVYCISGPHDLSHSLTRDKTSTD